MNPEPTFRPASAGALTRMGAGVAALALAAALTSCSFSAGELNPIGSAAAPSDAAAPADTDTAGQDATDQNRDGQDGAGEPADTGGAGGGLPVDPSEAVAWDGDTYWLSGTGDTLYRLDWTASAATTLQLTHAGSANFIVVPYAADGTRLGSVANEIGAYEGSSVLGEAVIGGAPEEVEFLHIQADGGWTLAR